MDALTIFKLRLKDLKKKLPNRVSFIAPMKGADSQTYLRFKVDSDFYRLTIPSDYNLTEAAWTRIVTLINEKLV
jgi:hypothetical protein